MISIGSKESHKFIDVLRTMRSIIEQLLEILNHSQLTESRKLVRALNDLEKRTARPQIKLAIVGDSEARKQKLIAAFLRMDLRGFGLPQTESRCLYLAYGSEPDCAVALMSGMTARLPLAELSDFVGSQASTSEVHTLLVRIPNEVLRAGVVVIDTPAIEQTSNEISGWTHSAIEDADACLLVIKGSEHLSERVSLLLNETKAQAHKFFVIVDSPAQSVVSSLTRELEKQGSAGARGVFRVEFLEPTLDKDFSGIDILETVRTELMKFARISSQTAMAGELHRLAQEARGNAEQARSSARTLLLRMKLGSCVKSLASICSRSEALLAQMVAELSNTTELGAPARAEGSPGKPVEVSAVRPAAASPNPAETELDSHAQGGPSKPLSSKTSPVKMPAWQQSLSVAANESGNASTVRSTALQTPEMESQTVEKRFPSSVMSVPPLASDAASETVTVASLNQSHLLSTFNTRSAPTDTVVETSSRPSEERQFHHDSGLTYNSAAAAESSLTSSYRFGVDASDENGTVDRRKRFIRQLVATFAVFACAGAIMLGLQYRQPFEESHSNSVSTLESSPSESGGTKVVPDGSREKRPAEAWTSTEASSKEAPPARAASDLNTEINATQDMHAKPGTTSTTGATTPNPRDQSRAVAGLSPTSNTPVTPPATAPRGEVTIQDPSLRATIDQWTNSYRTGNVEEQVSCYAPFVDTYFNLRNVRPEQVALDRKNTWGKIASVQQYRITPIRVTDQGNGQQSVMLQKEWSVMTTRGTIFSGSDLEKLIFVKIDNAWKIVDEVEIKTPKSK